MAATITLQQLLNVGSAEASLGTGNLGTYATGGVAVAANLFGLPRLGTLLIQSSGGYDFGYNSSTGKILAYGSGGVGAHSHDLAIIGAQAAGSTAITAYYATDIFGKEAATDKTIAGVDSATKGGISANTVPTSGAIGAEIDNATDLSAITFSWRASTS
jgi:hypothetical protein